MVVDIGGLSSKADWSVISVFDRKALTRTDGYLERAATWRGHIDHDWLAWKAAQIATLYGKALLAIESNTLETKDAVQIQTSEGDHFYTVIDELSEHYSNLYMRTSEPDVAREGVTYRYGWHTNVRTKYLAYDQCRPHCVTANMWSTTPAAWTRWAGWRKSQRQSGRDNGTARRPDRHDRNRSVPLDP